ncbi:hypothetical protein [Paenibacillus sp. B1-33]
MSYYRIYVTGSALDLPEEGSREVESAHNPVRLSLLDPARARIKPLKYT